MHLYSILYILHRRKTTCPALQGQTGITHMRSWSVEQLHRKSSDVGDRTAWNYLFVQCCRLPP